jgi:thiol-disulfide isomerase/thioredoxin
MKKNFTLTSLALLSLSALSQPAPDFTITATDGNVHELYADHLDQGQTVVIEIMFTSCPPCNAFAPYLEPLNQYWGAGQYDVQFFCLSDKNFDKNAAVLNWLTGHGITFPGAGSDGGALAALQPYTSGQYGGFWGTPTFVVIAPDGTVNYNVGSNNSGQAKADAISAAVAATGALPPPLPVHIDGKIDTPSGLPVGQVKLSVFPGYPDVFTTDSTGAFDFTLNLTPGVNYRLFASKNLNYGNGVTTFDMVMITKHILAVAPFKSIYPIIAADVNLSNSISTFDMVALRKLILSVDTLFPNGKSWRFIRKDCDPLTLPNTCPLDTVKIFTTEDDMTEIVLIGIKMGDANFSADGNSFSGDEDPDKAHSTISFSEKNRQLEAGKNVRITLNVKDLQTASKDLLRMQFDDATLQLMDFEELVPGCSLANFYPENGWTHLRIALPGKLSPEQALFHLHFKVKKNSNLGDALRFRK